MNKKTNKMTKGYAAGGAVGNDLASVYQNSLGRAPDAEGLAFFQQQLDSGQSLDSIRGLIQGSQEGQTFAKGQIANIYQSRVVKRVKLIQQLRLVLLSRIQQHKQQIQQIQHKRQTQHKQQRLLTRLQMKLSSKRYISLHWADKRMLMD